MISKEFKFFWRWNNQIVSSISLFFGCFSLFFFFFFWFLCFFFIFFFFVFSFFVLIFSKNAILIFSQKDRKTPLHYAARNGFKEIVKILLERGANIEAEDQVYSQTTKNEILFLFIYLIILIFSKKYQQTPLHDAAWNGYEEIAEILLERGANVEALDQVYSQTMKNDFFFF